MSNARVFWTELPTEREKGGALPVEEISGVEVLLGFVGATPALVETVLPDVFTAKPVSDLEIGKYEFQLVVVDTEGEKGAAVPVPFEIFDTSPPGIVIGEGVEIT